MSGPDLAIFMPAYNPGALLPETVARIPPEVWSRIRALFVVDDGSTDSTAETVRLLSTARPAIRLRRFDRNRGYGAAVREGLRLCAAEPVAAALDLHSDGQYAPESIPALLRAFEHRGLDVVQGSRHARGTAREGGMPLIKLVAGRLLSALENAVFALRLTDYHSGMILFSRRALGTIPFDALSGSFDFDLEAIACARALGLRIGEVPIPTRYAGEVSHLRSIPYGLRCLKVVARYAAGAYRGRRAAQPAASSARP
ncbi:MAG: glycosyltransferase family 2 protein [Planctomycetes bacterium]|nr:glycosyltransferase family 2 protein [Planctomycetota bacterium]